MNEEAEGVQPRTVPVGFWSHWETLQNPNVQRVVIFSFINGMCFSLWFTQVFQVMVNKISGDTTVGWLSATSGGGQVAGAFVASLAENLPRQSTIHLAAIIGMIAVALSIYSVAVLQVSVFFFSSTLWGLYLGMASTGTEALFADSVENGRRDFVYNLKWINETLCNCVGSLVCLLMLLRLGNEWDMHSMQILMYTGLALHPIAHLILFTMKDKYALNDDAKGGKSQTAGVPFSLTEGREPRSKSERQLLTSSPTSNGCIPREPDANNSIIAELVTSTSTTAVDKLTNAENAPQFEMQQTRRKEAYLAAQQVGNWAGRAVASIRFFGGWFFGRTAVPYILCFGDLCVAIGSGMTLRYIPLFFVNEYDVKPVVLMGTYIAVYVTTAMFSFLVVFLGRKCVGRVASVIFVRLFGTTLLLIMALTHLPIFIILPIFVFRNAAMNSTTGTTRSVIMDCVRKESRAKWSALESFTSFTWAGSAVIGGYIAEAKGYQYTFFITAIFHYFALMMMIPAIYGARDVGRQCQRQWNTEERNIRSRVESALSLSKLEDPLLPSKVVASR